MKFIKGVEVGIRGSMLHDIVTDAWDNIWNSTRIDVWDSIRNEMWMGVLLPIGDDVRNNVRNTILGLRG